MNAVTQAYDTLAELLRYPTEGTLDRLAARGAWFARHAPEAAVPLDSFARRIDGLSTEELQELYTQAFDLNPICSLEVGWQLFGENYSRGEFLVEMRRILRRLHVPESTELPDHLTHVLAALGRMSAREADRFASKYLLPAVDKMQRGLNGKNCPYECVLAAIQPLVLSPYGVTLEEASDG